MRGDQTLHIPSLKTFLEIGSGMMKIIDERNLGLVAAGVAFYAMFAIFPALAAVVSVWSWLAADPEVLESYLLVARGFIPDEAFGLIAGQVSALVAASAQSGIGWRTLISLMIALWSTRAGLASVVQGLNAIHGYPNHRTAKQFLLPLILTMTVLGMAILALATVVVLPILLHILPLGPIEGRIIGGIPWVITFLLLLVTIAMVYRYGPNTRRALRAGWLTPGAGLAAALWAAASLAFSLYLSNFGAYNRVYGSLGAGVALLMWFYLSAYAVLLGAALNHVLGIPRPHPDEVGGRGRLRSRTGPPI
ncbi:YihY/virulence factor BrkB family protein [Frigidibacter sp. MR17.24]|uniref:YihY/virulence factor BrkB family protein n=1 Tax=Frigidibacter sp. MR17.24 TaxID=3127345 RepID=UPI003012CCC0